MEDDEKDIVETKLITEDELKKFRLEFSNVVSNRALDKTSEYQAIKKYNSYLGYIQEEIRKVDDPVIAALFDLQTDIYKAMMLPPPPKR
jgi:hypothetical protein